MTLSSIPPSAFSSPTPLCPVLLCGGSGTRLWPLSRSTYPKQFMELDGHTLFGDTVIRALSLGKTLPPEDLCPPLVLCNEEQRFLTAASLQQLNTPGKIILEPMARNTAPAIALAALAALSEPGSNTDERKAKDETDPLLLVLPCDHAISPVETFARTVCQAMSFARAGHLVTFGICPRSPETGYGYIKQGAPAAGGSGGFEVARFVEKPQLEAAEAMLNEGGYLWNSGMFLFRASVFLRELKNHAPAIYEACTLAWDHFSDKGDFIRVPAEIFAKAPAVSIDYAVMERTAHAVVMPLDASWSDLGSWESFHAAAAKDEQGNARIGDVLLEDTKDCYVYSTRRLVATLGVTDLVVVETPDAVLVTRRDTAQNVKALVQRLADAHRPEKDNHLLVYRPWGSYEVLAPNGTGPQADNHFLVKQITVNPGAALSLQLHHHRAEHWVVVHGTARVTVGESVRLLKEDESTYIPLGTVHRLENPGCIPLSIIEIQTGSYLGEDDIVRLEDTYGRILK